jgi:hypothetical protein
MFNVLDLCNLVVEESQHLESSLRSQILDLLDLVEAQIQPLQVHEAFFKTWLTGPLKVLSSEMDPAEIRLIR